MLAQLLQSLYICTVFTHVNNEVIQTEMDQTLIWSPSVTSICRRICLVFLQLGRSETSPSDVLSPLREFVTITFLREESVTSPTDIALYTAAESDQISYGTYTELRQMPFHRKLHAVVLIYKPMAQIFTVQPTQLERFPSHFIDLYKNSCSAVKPFV